MESGVCAVVGAGPGLGLAIARRFGREGFRVALLARSEEKLAGQRDELAAAGIEARAFAADAGSAASLARAFERVRGELGDPSVLAYNAAAVHPAPPSALDPELLIQDLRINVAGALVSAQAVLPAMRARRSGTILFTGGGLALEPFPPVSSLSVGKAGIRSLALSLSKELEPEGIHAATVTVCGFIKPGTRFDPDLIAEEFWNLHAQPAGSWVREITYR
ncbi:MAG: SDR family NAD(P)-dependent oxidoreductase [Polyangiaceae bacterium]|nr:SDR family NAD(P)-dependent oxidoreductase [Polyangiaceae bacterium]